MQTACGFFLSKKENERSKDRDDPLHALHSVRVGGRIEPKDTEGPTLFESELLVELQYANGILAQEFGPHLILERVVFSHLRELPLHRDSGGEIAAIQDLVGAACVGVFDDLFGVMLRSKCTRAVVPPSKFVTDR